VGYRRYCLSFQEVAKGEKQKFVVLKNPRIENSQGACVFFSFRMLQFILNVAEGV
jgi:hypothetical protein